MDTILVEAGGLQISVGDAVATGIVGGLVLFAALITVLAIGWRRASARADEAALRADDAAHRADDNAARTANFERQVGELLKTQTEMQGRMQTMAEVFGSRQSDLVRGLSERMDGLGHKLGQSMLETTKNTHENLSRLAERLAVIDKAQTTITSLSSQVVELQQVLANKQTRGAFGEARMQTIIQDGLPSSAYSFQTTLSNGTRPDCLVLFPNGAPALVIDAKFPLEGWNAIRAADSAEEVRAAETRFKRDTIKHIQDIASRYRISGETHDTAFMFVPSESIFADIHERFDDVVQRAHRAQVVIVSPSLLMLSVQVMMSLLRDARMREQAHVIQHEVVKLMEDVARLDDRVSRLKGHFAQANKDIEQIEISSGKVTRRGDKITSLEVEALEDGGKARVSPAANSDGPPELPLQA